jgi:hypothetical protein
VCKKKVVPQLRHNPGASRKRPRAVIVLNQGVNHWGSELGAGKCYPLRRPSTRSVVDSSYVYGDGSVAMISSKIVKRTE